MNNEQRKILRRWVPLLLEFARREWFSLLIWSALGAVAAATTHLLVQDRLFKAFLKATYFPSPEHLDDPRLYVSYASAVTLIVFALAAIYGVELAVRGVRSWVAGVTSGLCLLPFTSMFVILTLPVATIPHPLGTHFATVTVFFVAGFLLHLAGKLNAERTLNEDDLRVPLQWRSLVGSELSESDDPIQHWQEDALGRASLVDSISIKLMIAKSPVVGLFGEFGSGKTSILNLLREHIGEKAIVVSFSTWLPGSQETLTAYLLGDIANQCQKHYVVPGLSKSARRLAGALAQAVPFLKGYSELFPAATQKDDIESMNTALSRLPKRVVVLLDELDRMEKEELLTLLKVIRGVASLRNLSFVCAADRETIVRTVKEVDNDESQLYFEKFFPVVVQVPKADVSAIRKAGTQRLVAAFNRRGWFENEAQAEHFRKQIDDIWSERIAPFCRTLRAIGLLSNDVSTAAALLRREVHPVDLTLVELLRRFKPSIYDVVGRNSVTLTGGESWLKGGEYRSDMDAEVLKQRLLADIQKRTKDDEQADQVKGILCELFPRFEKIAGQRWAFPPGTLRAEEPEKRIFNPGIFPAYFRYELPQGLFSSVEMETFVQRISGAKTDAGRQRTFLERLESMEKGSPKRDDFLEKLSDVVKSMSPQTGQALVHAAMRAADNYVYDSFFVAFGEAGHVLRMVIRVAEKTSPSERLRLLSECILEAADDTMAFRICTGLTTPKSDANLGVSLEDLYPSFRSRMLSRYGPEVNATNVDLSTSDKDAFNLWGFRSPDDRGAQANFWLGYIGNSRARLAQVFQGIFMPIGIYENDPTPFVENKIPIAQLKRLYETLPDSENLSESERKSLRRLKQFLDGRFKKGINLGELDDVTHENGGNGNALEPES